MTPAVRIEDFQVGDEDKVIGLIVPIQAGEFGVAITAEDQPDLKAIPDFYQTGHGGFWVARAGQEVVGTISLKDIGNGQGALRKMFVAAGHRGGEARIAGRLLDHLLDHARARGLRQIILGTTHMYHAAHRFYEKNGFAEVAEADLPPAFPRMVQDTKFYAMGLEP